MRKQSLHILRLCMLVIPLLSGCSVTSSSPDDGNGLTGVGSLVKKGVQRITARGPSNESRQNNSATFIAEKYPLDEMPHVMMKKPLAQGRLSSGYGYRLNPQGLRLPQRHKGVDYVAPKGTPVYAAADGIINKRFVSKLYGNYVRIRHENGFDTAYAHLDKFAESLKIGDAVKQGDLIGEVGKTGNAAEPHLHFELIYRERFINPLFESGGPSAVSGQKQEAGG